jgi:hypothetical protein
MEESPAVEKEKLLVPQTIGMLAYCTAACQFLFAMQQIGKTNNHTNHKLKKCERELT